MIGGGGGGEGDRSCERDLQGMGVMAHGHDRWHG